MVHRRDYLTPEELHCEDDLGVYVRFGSSEEGLPDVMLDGVFDIEKLELILTVLKGEIKKKV